MAETTVRASNVAIKYRGKPEREMPVVSKAQNAAMHAAEEGKSTIGIPKKVGKKFVAESQGTKVKTLPKHVRRAHARGQISDAAMKKHFGG